MWFPTTTPRSTNPSTPFQPTSSTNNAQIANQASQPTVAAPLAPLQNETHTLSAPRWGGGLQQLLQIVPQDLPPGQNPVRRSSAVIFATTAESQGAAAQGLSSSIVGLQAGGPDADDLQNMMMTKRNVQRNKN